MMFVTGSSVRSSRYTTFWHFCNETKSKKKITIAWWLQCNVQPLSLCVQCGYHDPSNTIHYTYNRHFFQFALFFVFFLSFVCYVFRQTTEKVVSIFPRVSVCGHVSACQKHQHQHCVYVYKSRFVYVYLYICETSTWLVFCHMLYATSYTFLRVCVCVSVCCSSMPHTRWFATNPRHK